MKHLHNVLDGVANVLESFSTRRAYVRDSGGFSADSRKLAGDVRKISSDFRKQSDLAYESISSSASKKQQR